MAKNNLAKYAGWSGMVCILASFFLISFGIFTASSPLYQVLNLLGALGIAWNAYAQKALPSVVLNAIYASVALAALAALLFS